jgi:hypothetical protein
MRTPRVLPDHPPQGGCIGSSWFKIGTALKKTEPAGAGTHGSWPAAAAAFDHMRSTA